MSQPPIIDFVLRFDYVIKYQVGDRVEIPLAEELLANYNDFYSSNLEVYQGRIKDSAAVDNEAVAAASETGEELPVDPLVEQRINEDVKAFTDTWGSLDFASATLVGLEIDWDKIEEKVLREQQKKVRPADSELIPLARKLRKVASVLAFSERIVGRLRGKAVDKEMISLMVQGFGALLQQVHDHDIDFPELNGAENKKIAKIRTVDSILDYANQLFAKGR